mgnify:CR=1 FL=1
MDHSAKERVLSEIHAEIAPALSRVSSVFFGCFQNNQHSVCLLFVQIGEHPDPATHYANSDGVQIWATFEAGQCPAFIARTTASLNIQVLRPRVLTATTQAVNTLFSAIDPMFKDGEVVQVLSDEYVAPALPLISLKHMRFSMPWPVWGRDFVLAEYNDMFTDASGVPTALVVVRSVEAPSHPPHPSWVRGRILHCSYEFRQVQLDPPLCELTLRAQADPAGSIPRWALRFAITEQAKNLARMAAWAASIPGVTQPYDPAHPSVAALPTLAQLQKRSMAEALEAATAASRALAATPPSPAVPGGSPSTGTASVPRQAAISPMSTAATQSGEGDRQAAPQLFAFRDAFQSSAALPPTGELSTAPVFGRLVLPNTDHELEGGASAVSTRLPPRLVDSLIGTTAVLGPAGLAALATALSHSASAPSADGHAAALIRMAAMARLDARGLLRWALSARADIVRGRPVSHPLHLLLFKRPEQAPHAVVRGTWQNVLAVAGRLYPDFAPLLRNAGPTLAAQRFSTLEAQFRSAHSALVGKLEAWEAKQTRTERGRRAVKRRLPSGAGSLFARLAASPLALEGCSSLQRCAEGGRSEAAATAPAPAAQSGGGVGGGKQVAGQGPHVPIYDIRYFLYLRLGLPANFTGTGQAGEKPDWLAVVPWLHLAPAASTLQGGGGGVSVPPVAAIVDGVEVPCTAATMVDITQPIVAMLPPPGSDSETALRKALLAPPGSTSGGGVGDGVMDTVWSIVSGADAEEGDADSIRHALRTALFVGAVSAASLGAALYGRSAIDAATTAAADGADWVVDAVSAWWQGGRPRSTAAPSSSTQSV